jgi:hypothetical protein
LSTTTNKNQKNKKNVTQRPNNKQTNIPQSLVGCDIKRGTNPELDGRCENCRDERLDRETGLANSRSEEGLGRIEPHEDHRDDEGRNRKDERNVEGALQLADFTAPREGLF